MAVSPSQRTLNYLRGEGWPFVQSVEKWIPQARRRKDLFRFADILALHPQWGHLYVQATTGAHVNARLFKMQEWASEEIEAAIKAGAKVQIHGWRKLQGHGNKKWFPKILNVGINEVYDMTKDEWGIAYDFMLNVWHGFPTKVGAEGDLDAYVQIDSPPPQQSR